MIWQVDSEQISDCGWVLVVMMGRGVNMTCRMEVLSTLYPVSGNMVKEAFMLHPKYHSHESVLSLVLLSWRKDLLLVLILD